MKKLFSLLLCFCMILPLASCQTAPEPLPTPEPEVGEPAATPSTEVENLEKLCKVWGYTKYRHPVFLKGEKDWDAELLALIPQVREAKSDEDVNALLYNWFLGLGEIDYTSASFPRNLHEDDTIVQADISWADDAEYLGQSLVDELGKIKTVPSLHTAKAPVLYSGFSSLGSPAPIFQETPDENSDFSDQNHCLLGLFRMWNAIEYFFPYLEILDENWHDQLSIYIPKMLEVSDVHSYALTLASLSTKLQDAHASIIPGDTFFTQFGNYGIPVFPVQAEGKIVIQHVLDPDCLLLPGDVILTVDNIPINEVIADRKQYIPITSEDKIANTILPYVLLSHNETMKLSVLRDGQEHTFDVQGTPNFMVRLGSMAQKSHEVLEGNIGLINPQHIKDGVLPTAMEELKDTDGLIIDLRQYPGNLMFLYEMANYIVEGNSTFALYSSPFVNRPGTYLTTPFKSGNIVSSAENLYSKNVVILMDEHTQSQAEMAVMALRGGSKVTVMGSDSVGSDGDVTILPLPGNILLTFTGHSFYTPDGGQTQRVGLSPDIRVEPTIQGIKEGRDEVLEAAIQYLKENR